MLRLNSTTYPSYMCLQAKDFWGLHIDEKLSNHFKSDTLKIAQRAFDVFHSIPTDCHYYITESFNNVVHESRDKLVPLVAQAKFDYSKNKVFESAILMHHMGFALHKIGFEDGEAITHLFVFSRTALIGYSRITHSGDLHVPDQSYGYMAINRESDGYKPESLIAEIFQSYLSILFFIEFCEIETKVLSPKEKTKIAGQKYYNEQGKSPVTILDCRWFTELIRNAPFGVRGHLRWQRCGEGRSKRKLIWIDSFEKKGYHRRAQKQLAQE
jgi:hypothetical protein